MDGVTIALGATAALTTCAAMTFAVLAECHKQCAESRLRSAERWKSLALELCDRLHSSRMTNLRHEFNEDERQAQRVAAAHKSGEVAKERARERREARTNKTTAALCSAPLRPRDEVVAGVRK